MSQQARRSRGPRFTPPQVKAPDIRDGSAHPAQLLGHLYRQAAGGRLPLGGVQHAATPPALAQIEYVCDRPDLTGFAGMPAFMQFCYGAGLADWVLDLPLARRRDAIYPPGKLCEVVVAILAAGLERVSHIDDVKDDPGLCMALGLQRLPDQATLSRFFSDATPEAVAFLPAVNHSFSAASTSFLRRPGRLIVDVDTRDVGVYGKQEGAKRSPRNDGDPIYTFEAVTLRNGRDLLRGELLEGATHPAPLFRERLEAVLAQLGSTTAETILCADAAWYADYVLEMIEQADADAAVRCQCKYAIRAQMRGELKHLIAAVGEECWQRYDEYTEVAEVAFAFSRPRDEQGRTRQKACPTRRYVVTRQRLKDRADEAQGTLLEQPRYAYRAIVTNLDWAPRRIVKLYNDRATVESILKESALGFHMDSLPSQSFAGNGLFCQLLVLAYNLVNLFRRLCLPEEGKRQQVPGLRRRLLAVPGLVRGTEGDCVLHCAATGPHVGWLGHLLAALERWLPSPGLMPAVAAGG